LCRLELDLPSRSPGQPFGVNFPELAALRLAEASAAAAAAMDFAAGWDREAEVAMSAVHHDAQQNRRRTGVPRAGERFRFRAPAS
jgi:hypothetical protein